MTRGAHPLRGLWAGLGIAAVSLGLLACSSGHDGGDLAQWMAQQRASARPQVPEIQPPAAYQPQPYEGVDAPAPFSEERLVRVLRSDAASGASSRLIESEMRRRREPLEEFPLDAITMVGLLDMGGRRVALVRANGLLYQVATGHYLGQNYGRVTAVSDHQITLREIVQDAAGEWVERTATLQLQEGTGP
ncbi:MAG: pilus assembly protein PilP [Tepidimonas sp.]|uniref:pilus assembly protein PilP n=1 Tax=Tepidimonas sp. TaxID=2002775 RepID=UPI00259E094D|nr:pilus assembly protein PilP [Tepidimonas sp.]MDM7456848.1 pilus assembly protein PilP [Tepidimonas sp.]